jgi:hypothetical protein
VDEHIEIFGFAAAQNEVRGERQRYRAAAVAHLFDSLLDDTIQPRRGPILPLQIPVHFEAPSFVGQFQPTLDRVITNAMKKSTHDNAKRTRIPRPKGTGVLVGVRLQPPALAPLDAWIARQPNPKPSRPEAVRRLMAAGLGLETKQ